MKPYYADDLVTLYHGDSRDVLTDLDIAVDLLLTDPPYGQQFAGAGVKTAMANIRADGARQGVRVVRQTFHEVDRLMAPDAHALSFCHWESWPDFYDAVSPLWPIKSALIWWKNRGGMGDCEMEYARDYEVILYGARGRRPIVGRRDGAVIEGFPPVGSDRQHPTEKPVPLMKHLISRHAPPRWAGPGSVRRKRADALSRSRPWPPRHRHRDRRTLLRDRSAASRIAHAFDVHRTEGW